MSKNTRWLAGLALLLALVGCGGGGGGSSGGGGGGGVDTPPPVLPQGIWRGSNDDGTLAVMVVPESTGGTVWAVGRGVATTSTNPTTTATITSLYQASLSASGQSFAGTGTALAVVGTAVPTSTPGLTVTVAAGSPAGQTILFALNGEVGALTYGSHYDTPASLTASPGSTLWAGTWASAQSVQGLGSVVTQWTVASNGAVTGSGTGGCTYTGTVLPRSEGKALVNVTLTETCGGSVFGFTGVGAPGVDANNNVVGRLVVLRRDDGQSFSVMQWSASGV